ncbi:MAG: DUF2807 domain-containing protein [bacterium]|nr:DUF2807 domain-containing protein [bacterium]MCP4798368.1 DUF2807 domain-containing protein [bacterium]
MKRIVLLSLTALLIASACSAGWFFNSTKGSGDIITVDRDVSMFDSVTLKGSPDVFIDVGPLLTVTVTADDNIVDLIKTESKNGTLFIEIEKSVRTKKTPRIDITVPYLEKAKVNGSGDIYIQNFDAETMELNVNGSGDIKAEGNCRTLEIEVNGSGDIACKGSSKTVYANVNGSGDIKLKKFIADDVDAEVNGSGDINIFANKSFKGFVSGSGDIRCYGDPEIRKNKVKGSGDIDYR